MRCDDTGCPVCSATCCLVPARPSSGTVPVTRNPGQQSGPGAGSQQSGPGAGASSRGRVRERAVGAGSGAPDCGTAAFVEDRCGRAVARALPPPRQCRLPARGITGWLRSRAASRVCRFQCHAPHPGPHTAGGTQDEAARRVKVKRCERQRARLCQHLPRYRRAAGRPATHLASAFRFTRRAAGRPATHLASVVRVTPRAAGRPTTSRPRRPRLPGGPQSLSPSTASTTTSDRRQVSGRWRCPPGQPDLIQPARLLRTPSGCWLPSRRPTASATCPRCSTSRCDAGSDRSLGGSYRGTQPQHGGDPLQHFFR